MIASALARPVPLMRPAPVPAKPASRASALDQGLVATPERVGLADIGLGLDRRCNETGSSHVPRPAVGGPPLSLRRPGKPIDIRQ